MNEYLLSHWLDITTTILGLAYIVLEYRASLWMWLVGFVMEALGVVLYYDKGLYADCAMEAYYMAMTVYGWSRWVKTPPKAAAATAAAERAPLGQGGDDPSRAAKGGSDTTIAHFPRRLLLPWLAIMGGLWATIYWLLVTFTNSNVPLADSFTTALSLVGIWALAHKYLEQWFVWVAVDVVTSVLYFHKDIPFKASLYALYVVIAVMGYFRWRRMMREAAATGG